MNTLAVHLYHDSTLALSCDGVICNIELERIFRIRHYDWHQASRDLDALASLLPREHRFHAGLTVGETDQSAEALFERLGIPSVRRIDHHAAHAAAAFYQSPYDRSLIVSYDGGGNDGTFRTFIASRNGGLRALAGDQQLNLGIPYRALAHAIADIKKPDDGRELSNAGKLMGFAAFGQVRPEWIAAVRQYYCDCSAPAGDVPHRMYNWVRSHLPSLGTRLGVDLARDALTGAAAFDLARTAQDVFETLVLERVLPIAEQHRVPVCLTGGCALNVSTNQRLASLLDVPIFVPPNPNDCGLALGALLFDSKPPTPVNVVYSGTPILDLNMLPAAVEHYAAVPVDVYDVAQLLSQGCIVAVMRGNSEHGPRALGNRSILCHPALPGIKQRLDREVKFREPFRPYGAVVRASDVGTYFEDAKNDMSFMSFNPKVKSEWRGAFSAACHVDYTSRAQTVTAGQNRWLHDVLTEFLRITGCGALLNTSFNSKGRPIVTRVADALEIFASSDIDCLVIGEWLFRKHRNVTTR